uniref:Uncharacterized protein n=1 Tax=Timema cristinae TaxID=61476 RepID=A0A7R9GX13_TIMCR|nr:unnamed protein product [Timema cristinae]
MMSSVPGTTTLKWG